MPLNFSLVSTKKRGGRGGEVRDGEGGGYIILHASAVRLLVSVSRQGGRGGGIVMSP